MQELREFMSEHALFMEKASRRVRQIAVAVVGVGGGGGGAPPRPPPPRAWPAHTNTYSPRPRAPTRPWRQQLLQTHLHGPGSARLTENDISSAMSRVTKEHGNVRSNVYKAVRPLWPVL